MVAGQQTDPEQKGKSNVKIEVECENRNDFGFVLGNIPRCTLTACPRRTFSSRPFSALFSFTVTSSTYRWAVLKSMAALHDYHARSKVDAIRRGAMELFDEQGSKSLQRPFRTPRSFHHEQKSV